MRETAHGNIIFLLQPKHKGTWHDEIQHNDNKWLITGNQIAAKKCIQTVDNVISNTHEVDWKHPRAQERHWGMIQHTSMQLRNKLRASNEANSDYRAHHFSRYLRIFPKFFGRVKNISNWMRIRHSSTRSCNRTHSHRWKCTHNQCVLGYVQVQLAHVIWITCRTSVNEVSIGRLDRSSE